MNTLTDGLAPEPPFRGRSLAHAHRHVSALNARSAGESLCRKQVTEPVSRRMSRSRHSTTLDIEFGETARLHAGPGFPRYQRATTTRPKMPQGRTR